LDGADMTLPDFVAGEATNTWGAVVVVNASAETLNGVTLQARLGATEPESTPLPPMIPLSVRKVGFRLRGSAPAATSDCPLALTVRREGVPEPLDLVKVALRVRRPQDSRKRTFRSGIDGSVQYYAVNPARPLSADDRAPALILTLHGAAVEATGQADS